MSICTAPVYKLKELNNLFIEMTSKNCNQRCSECYINFQGSKNVKDFIPTDTIKKGLSDVKNQNIYCIYLSGAEPMTHADFNSILRLCLKKCNVCICTNASFLNEKKVRFLKKVEDEGTNQIFFKLPMAHYDEILNDKVRYRGSYRQVISALKILTRYNFVSVVSFCNYYKLDKNDIISNLTNIFRENSIENTDIKITVSHPTANYDYNVNADNKTDCMRGRTLCRNGVYSCPFLANDYRGRVGSSLSDFSKFMTAETDFCLSCAINGESVFAID